MFFYLGIEYKKLNKIQSDSTIPITDFDRRDSTEKMDDTDDEGNFDEESSGIQIKRSKTYFSKEDILIEGSLALAELVDFLINQKDKHSYAILPEIYSPGPFIYGTLRSNSVTFLDSCKGPSEVTHQLKIAGIIFPDSISAVLRELKEYGHKLTFIAEREPNTDYLAAYSHYC